MNEVPTRIRVLRFLGDVEPDILMFRAVCNRIQMPRFIHGHMPDDKRNGRKTLGVSRDVRSRTGLMQKAESVMHRHNFKEGVQLTPKRMP